MCGERRQKHAFSDRSLSWSSPTCINFLPAPLPCANSGLTNETEQAALAKSCEKTEFKDTSSTFRPWIVRLLSSTRKLQAGEWKSSFVLVRIYEDSDTPLDFSI